MITKYFVDAAGHYLGSVTSAPPYTVRTPQEPVPDPETGEPVERPDLVETVTPELVPPPGGIEVPSPPADGRMIWAEGAWTFTADMLRQHLSTVRWQHEVGGITHAGMQVATDRDSQGKVLAARVAAVVDPAYSLTWKAGNGFFTLDGAGIVAMADAVGNHVRAAFVAEAVASAGIDAGNLIDPAAVEAAFIGAL